MSAQQVGEYEDAAKRQEDPEQHSAVGDLLVLHFVHLFFDGLWHFLPLENKGAAGFPAASTTL
jgi:hypothetical protein